MVNLRKKANNKKSNKTKETVDRVVLNSEHSELLLEVMEDSINHQQSNFLRYFMSVVQAQQQI